MPRTKKVPATKRIESIKEPKTKEILSMIDEEERKIMDIIKAKKEEALKAIDMHYVNIKAKIPLKMLNGTIKDIESGMLNNTTMNSTKSSKKNQTLCSSRMLSKRSLSLGGEDEGYTTAESTRGTSSGYRATRMSRSRTKKPTSKTTSRSLSRNTTKNVTAFITPTNKQSDNTSIGSITPKVKPNTPLHIVRRPKIGEMAWSNQGSPVLTSHTIARENTANVNIPLPDGNLMSLLPQRGIRVSQMPPMDMDIIHQLQILRDNLIKVCNEVAD